MRREDDAVPPKHHRTAKNRRRERWTDAPQPMVEAGMSRCSSAIAPVAPESNGQSANPRLDGKSVVSRIGDRKWSPGNWEPWCLRPVLPARRTEFMPMPEPVCSPMSRFRRGYALLYHPGETNHCPACGQRHWIIGRMMAQCARCDTALPLDGVHGIGYAPRFINGHHADGVGSLPQPVA